MHQAKWLWQKLSVSELEGKECSDLEASSSSCPWVDLYLVIGLPKWPSGKRIRLPMQETVETQGGSLGREEPLEQKMATHSTVLAWKIPWTEEPGGLQSVCSQSWTQMRTSTILCDRNAGHPVGSKANSQRLVPPFFETDTVFFLVPFLCLHL